MWDVNPDVLVTDLGDELVLMHPVTGLMFGLNGTGRDVWLALPAPVETLAQMLVTAHGAPLDDARQDVQAMIQDLEARGLLRQVSPADD